ncbi:MAG: hypothetical protein D6719_01080 [Candidatus Dadabacteria bacterium]|nr:MAG: hypothetical protein D6719_01080 [Candidatus Dadabacteria bacterium]
MLKFRICLLWLFAFFTFGCHTVLRPADNGLNSGWISAHYRSHQLSGRIWSVQERSFISERALLKRIQRYNLLLLGEKHDNPDHHRLRSELLRKLCKERPIGTVLFEQLAPGEGEKLGKIRDPDRIASILDWKKRGWPDFKFYKPLFEAAVGCRAKIDGAKTRRVDAKQQKQLQSSYLSKVREDTNLRNLRLKELKESHCNMVPEKILPKILKRQKLWDAEMADALIKKSRSGGQVILLAGNGHIRKDYGVPRYLEAAGIKNSFLSLAFLEVRPELKSPPAYSLTLYAQKLPYDYVWFTPVYDPVDPCRKYFGRK